MDSGSIIDPSETIINPQIVISRLPSSATPESIVAGHPGKNIVTLILKSILGNKNTFSTARDQELMVARLGFDLDAGP